jgi:hypothetical protein
MPDKKGANKPKVGSLAMSAPRGPVVVQPRDTPPPVNRPKRIHSRRLLPFVREGQERERHSLNVRAFIAAPQAAGQEVRIVRNTPLPQPGLNHVAGAVGEPSLAMNGDFVLLTGNWYAAISIDAGRTFRFLDPNDMAQPTDPPGVTFCCDQVVNYMPSIDTFVWLLQYGPNTGDNIQRLAFATTADAREGKWRTFDITTAALELPGFFLDFPDLAVGANFLYMTTNCFGPDQQTVGSAVVRIPLASIAAGAPTAEKFVDLTLDSFRVAQNCREVAFFAAHQDTSTLSVFSWPESQAVPTSHEVSVARWIGTNGYSSRTPANRRWLDRVDPRITGATLAENELWFAWSVDAGSNHRPKPFVQMARINAQTLALIEDVNLFDDDSAIAYAGLATNANDDIGVSYAMGGGDLHPSYVVGVLSANEANRRSLLVAKGERSPMPDAKGHFDWGDYLTARAVHPNRRLFAGVGYTLEGHAESDNQDATPRFVIFGREADAAGGEAPPSGGNGPDLTTGEPPQQGPAPGAEVLDGPITDVNKLSTVTADVAKRIKAACGIHTGVHGILPPAEELALPQLVTKPGVERWPVKTGQDPNRNLVGKNIIQGVSLGAGIVPATVEELISMPRPPGLEDVKADPPAFQHKRSQPVETTIWRLNVRITVVKLEKDGDYHLVMQGASGETMVGEVPTATKTFIGDSPWLANIKAARKAVEDKLLHKLSPQDFILPPGGTMLVPRDSLSGDVPVQPMAAFRMPASFQAVAEGQEESMPTFMAAVPSTPARVTGVGFFDRSHGATGAAANVIELHPILKIEWL